MTVKNLCKLQLSVIVPCYNEAENLKIFADDLSVHLNEAVGVNKWHYLFVSNGCNDHTPEVLQKLGKFWPNTKSLFNQTPDYGYALRSGLKNAEGEWALIVNVDFWNAEFIYWAWDKRTTYDLIIGSKRAEPRLDKRPKYRRLLTWGLNVFLQVYFGAVTTDTHGLKLLHLQTLQPVLDRCIMNRGQFDTEFVLKSQRVGLKIAEVPVPITEKRRQRNLMLKKITQNIFDLRRLKREMKKTPFTSPAFYHRYSVPDVSPDACFGLDQQ